MNNEHTIFNINWWMFSKIKFNKSFSKYFRVFLEIFYPGEQPDLWRTLKCDDCRKILQSKNWSSAVVQGSETEGLLVTTYYNANRKTYQIWIAASFRCFDAEYWIKLEILLDDFDLHKTSHFFVLLSPKLKWYELIKTPFC